jgi:uncharacterized protein
MPNHLINESSPYLLQHAHNPVDWYPWGEDALLEAKQTDKPIFLSIGYAACHWCHVMAHESFEDQQTAEFMNRNFVNIKVDREERPDLDAIYMQATVGMTGQGGWPMSVFLTPAGVPYYAGTYFPNTPRQGMPSFKQVLAALAEAWSSRRDEVMRTTSGLLDFYRQESALLANSDEELKPEVAGSAVQSLSAGFDRVNGGWGRAPKFPQPMSIEFLLAHYSRTGNQDALRMAETSLTKMSSGGVYDQLGGGFHRYSTDAHWLVPHFEKMLYDNSQLALACLHAWQVTGNSLYQRIATETLDYVAREMTHPDGGFYSTQDADSEGVEGKFFVWSADEIWEALGDRAILFNDVFGVTRRGNFEGSNILHVAREPQQVAFEHSIPMDELLAILGESRYQLFAVRSQRVKPGRDEKILTAWNGLMLGAFAEAGRCLKRDDYIHVAQSNARFILNEMRTTEGRLMRTWKQGIGARLNGYLEDYAHLIDGLLSLYQTTFDEQWFVAAKGLADTMIAHFAATDGTFYDTSDDHETLVTRPRELQDNAVPSGNSKAVTVLLKLAAYTGESRYQDIAVNTLRRMQDSFVKYPTAFGQWLVAMEFALGGAKEVAIVGDVQQPDTQALLAVINGSYRPAQVVTLKQPGAPSIIPLLESRHQLDGKATVYVCQHFVCQMPVNDPEMLAQTLK